MVEQALVALGQNHLESELRTDAQRAAHMLAGSIGMFGFIDASEAARELESKLAQAPPDQTTALLALLERVRTGIRGAVTLRVPPGRGA